MYTHSKNHSVAVNSLSLFLTLSLVTLLLTFSDLFESNDWFNNILQVGHMHAPGKGLRDAATVDTALSPNVFTLYNNKLYK